LKLRITHFAIVSALMIAACTSKPVEQVIDARVTLPAVPGRPGAAYFTLEGGERPNLLLEISSPRAMRIELHEMVESGGTMRMSKIEGGVDVPAGDEVSFAPGGKHAMLFDIAPSVKPGEKLPLSFRYSNGRVIDVQAEVRAPGEADAGMSHHH
jgi:periplasmic copper chaperone A